MVGIAAACWWISHTPISATLSEKLFDGLTAVLVVTVTALGSYGWLYPDVMAPRFKKNVEAYAEQQIGEERVRISRALAAAQGEEQLAAVIADITADVADADGENWQRFTLAKLQQLAVEEHRTVMVDFTADWCTNCKFLEKVVLKTQAVEEALTRADVVTMEADYTKKPEAIDRTIKALGGVGVPVIAIFPAADPYRPIVFADGKYTQEELIDAIAEATDQGAAPSGNTALTQAAGDPRL
jgi:thiol:disulfide interchange protein